MIGSILQLMRRDVTRGITGTILLKVGSGGLAFALFTLAARAMSPKHSASSQRGSVLPMGCVVGLLGQEVLLVRFLNEYQVRGEADLTRGVLTFSLKVSAVAMLTVIAAVTFVAGIRGDAGITDIVGSPFYGGERRTNARQSGFAVVGGYPRGGRGTASFSGGSWSYILGCPVVR